MKMTRNDFHFRFYFRYDFEWNLSSGQGLTRIKPEVRNLEKMIKDDVEIQNWIGEVKRHGFTYADDAEIPQVPGWQKCDILTSRWFDDGEILEGDLTVKPLLYLIVMST